ncbi:MAG: ErfK/YbiS/YcfS/YnhG family protein [Microgenomates group bacterium Gr01-1014_7]|nr:MAG: ErfK/YbiS/YcfS/YnhG family protein [Microgenomates group bacterium Gr01-1014_7]
MLYRLLPVFIIIAVITFLAFNFQTIRRDLAYKLHISGDPTTSCCTVDQALKSKGEFDENASIAIFNSQIIDYPKTSLVYQYAQSLAEANSDQKVLGTTNAAGEEKWIEVNLDEQKLRAWEGNKLVMEFPVSSGLWAPTPKGTFNIWYKTRSQSMVGGSKDLGTYYNLPNVPNNMFFYQGYAIHGAYWHNNFGNPMSHGCVNSPLASAVQIFAWAGPVVPEGQNVVRSTAENPGTRVLVH